MVVIIKNMEKLWKYKRYDKKVLDKLVEGVGVSLVVAKLLVNRNIVESEDARKFLECDLKNLHNPRLMKDLEKGVKRVKSAILSNERILIFGDFDVDGVTSTVVLNKVIKIFEGDALYHFPNRLVDGYGLNKKAIDKAVGDGVGLIVTVDCGITANVQVDYANSKGIDVVIIDHHEQIGYVPNAIAVINPKQKDCNYPYKKLAAVGVIFKFVQVLIQEFDSDFDEFSLLDFVCLGTVADIVPLDGENRIIVKEGLKVLSNTKNLGLKALIEVSGLEDKEINSGHISFKLGPRINSSGRLESADKVMRLFNTESIYEAKKIAMELDRQNIERQHIQQEIFNQVVKKIEKEINFEKENCIVISGRGWHRGVIGIVASKIVEKYYRPTILISIDEDGVGYGSGRSIPNFHLLNSMNYSKKWMENYGGHSQAAGLKIMEKNIDGFREDVNEYSKDKLDKKDLIPVLNIDAELSLGQIDFGLIENVHQLFPYGMGNPRPVFSSGNIELEHSPRILKEKHLKLYVGDGVTRNIEAIGFGMSSFVGDVIKNKRDMKIAYFPEINEWNGNVSIKLGLKDIKFGNAA